MSNISEDAFSFGEIPKDAPVIEDTNKANEPTDVIELADDVEMPEANLNVSETHSEKSKLDEPIPEIPEPVIDLTDTPEVTQDMEPKSDNPVPEISEPIVDLTQAEIPDVAMPVSEPKKEEKKVEEAKTSKLPEVKMSDTPIEELNKLTEYTPNNISSTDINAIFDRISINVKDASEIFKRNSELKEKLDARFDELKTIQSEIDNFKKGQTDEIDKYKDEVLAKLDEKKNEMESRLNELKEFQASLEKEKNEFEQYKASEEQKIEEVQKEIQTAYDDRREELSRIEKILRKQKESLDEERNELSLEKIKYESDKNDLANSLLKFSEMVNAFTNGVEDGK